ncbi:MAG: oxygen-independent coproporphyrinogen III oxidase [Ruminococcaceae bacterium]|nr:oxygen-independent coproporphyrinogen III oxidase [Oscillospiraceae bacterium]
MTGLYIHIPFCVKKCKYCDFNSYSGCESLYEDYFMCLEKEIEKYEDVLFDTVYIGGGTPTVPPNYLLIGLIEKIKNKTEDCEITVECNPGTVMLTDFENLKSVGVNRISMGLQSADDEELEILGRVHSFSDFEESFKNARKAGFDNISLDIMFGLPEQNMEKLQRTLAEAVKFGAEHISCYCLKIEKGTPFYNMKLNLPDDDMSADMYDFCVSFLEENGYKRYEISNFAKNGKASRHNRKYWLMEEYVGIGAGAHSFLGDKRFSKIKNVKDYISAVKNGNDAVEELNPVGIQEKMSEFVFLGFRMTNGINEANFEKMFNRNIFDVYGDELKKYLDMGVMERKCGRIYIKPQFLYVSNNILSDFV